MVNIEYSLSRIKELLNSLQNNEFKDINQLLFELRQEQELDLFNDLPNAFEEAFSIIIENLESLVMVGGYKSELSESDLLDALANLLDKAILYIEKRYGEELQG